MKRNLKLFKRNFIFLMAFVAIVGMNSCNKQNGPPKVLIFSKTAAFYHESIPAGNEALLKLMREHNIEADTTTDAEWFNEEKLGEYSAVIFLNNTGDVLNHYQEVAFERYIQAGGGFVGIHAASDTEYDWAWYGRLVGAYFKNHPRPQNASFSVVDANHESTKNLPSTFSYDDEWYNYKKINPAINVLITIDESSYEGGENGENHPMAWYHEYDGGRSFFTGFGHSIASYSDSLHLAHFLGGIKYAIGGNHKLNYSKAKTLQVPERQRFVKTQLLSGSLFEPTEMAILPNYDILIAQRRGELMLFKENSGEVVEAGFLDVYHHTGLSNVNAEEGFMGLALDPDFEKNKFLYAFYSPADTSVNRLSRFVFDNGRLDMKSEKVVLEFYSQRQICCHTGGSIAFGGDGLLYVSTGDNSTPFDQPTTYKNKGFAPIDGREGFEQYDASRSSGNTNDLRGKILRIKMEADGSYSIPEGNLFAVGVEKTRPEIFVMGNRNPYRISVDQKNNYLYWGEVGPDASNDSLATRGPRGYDEINQARKAGFYGWPFFVGDNYAYRQYDYTNGKSGEPFDAEKPMNLSPNNTGLVNLPAAQPAYIWYPYGASADFPQVGSGGRNAMAGPVYYTDMFPKETRYPEYYNGKLIVYDWIRRWVKAVTIAPNGDFEKMEPFMEGEVFASPIDMEVGRDGRLYVLEYGSGWFSKNADAGIARIDYIQGNLPPKVGELKVEQLSGNLPFTVKATIDATDFEGDKMTYSWKIGNIVKETDEPVLNYVIDKKGEYEISVTVSDVHKAKSESSSIAVYAGNQPPVVDIILNSSSNDTYKLGDRIDYEVKIDDSGRALDEENLVVSVKYLKEEEVNKANVGHQQVSELVLGRSLMMASDCQSCHKLTGASVGPSFMQITDKYKKRDDAVSYLKDKVMKGGSGVWGQVAMAAHPDMKALEAEQIVKWILSLSDDKVNSKNTLPAKGVITANRTATNEGTILRIMAEYTNSPGPGTRPFTGVKVRDLKLKDK